MPAATVVVGRAIHTQQMGPLTGRTYPALRLAETTREAEASKPEVYKLHADFRGTSAGSDPHHDYDPLGALCGV